jgi:V/A-type H+/Na+-transporting ATPase subunit I
MFYPQEMTEIEIIVPDRVLLPVTKVLGGQGIFSQTDANYLTADKGNQSANQWQQKATAYSNLERRLQSILSSLNIKQSNPAHQDIESLVDVDSALKVVDDVEKNIKQIVDEINSENKRIEHLNNVLLQIEPLTGIDVNFSQLQNSRYIYSIIGMMPIDKIERLSTSLARIPHELFTLDQKQQKAVVWLAASRDNAEVLDRAGKSAYLDPISLPTGYEGTPAEIKKSINQSIQEAEEKIQKLKEPLAQIKQEKEKVLSELLWNIRCSRLTTNAILKYGKLKYTYIIVGWVFTSQVDALKEKLKTISGEIVTETRGTKRDKESVDVPTSLSNPKLIRPFQMLVGNYADPKYSELDPTPLVAILFPLLFGTMFGDVGHGLILVIIGWLATTKRAFKFLGSLSPIVLGCGIMSTIFGFLYGSILGYEDVLPALWLRPSEDIMTILIITIIAGVVVLSLGYILNFYNMLKMKDWVNAFFGHNGFMGALLYWSIIGTGLAFLMPALNLPKIPFLVAAIIGVLGVALSEVFIHLIEGHHPVIEGGIATFIVQVFFELLETFISYLSNTLSFVRVGAFAVAHGNLSGVFFILGSMVSPNKGVGYWIMFLIGVVFIVGFEGLIVGIQTMRLTYYEIFGKFFTGGGKRFEPLSLRPAENE